MYLGNKSWPPRLNLLLAIYSTVFSTIRLVVAIVRPRWGKVIHTGGLLAPSTATTLFALVSKTIEISSVAIFVTLLGQLLTRRSLSSSGVTIADMGMRTCIIQPGYALAHLEHLRLAGRTALGLVSLLAAMSTLLYTTASDALVSPHLKYGNWENGVMYTAVYATFANLPAIQARCPTPNSREEPLESGKTCVFLKNFGLSLSDLNSWLEVWAEINSGGVGVSSNPIGRPPASSSIFRNATTEGSWVQDNYSSATMLYNEFRRIVNNVTLSMPHAATYSARHAAQWQDTIKDYSNEDYLGKAALPSPTSNIECANINVTELSPLIYAKWPSARLLNSTNPQSVSSYQNDIQSIPGESYLNASVVDNIFKWGPNHGRQPPIFPTVCPGVHRLLILVRAYFILTSS